jgi:hypothetical protein
MPYRNLKMVFHGSSGHGSDGGMKSLHLPRTTACRLIADTDERRIPVPELLLRPAADVSRLIAWTALPPESGLQLCRKLTVKIEAVAISPRDDNLSYTARFGGACVECLAAYPLLAL